MKFRWKLSTLFAMILIAAIFLARYSYVQNRFAALRDSGAMLSFDWERPTLSANEFGTFQVVDNTPKQIWFVQRSLNTTPLQRTWFDRLTGWFVGDPVVAIIVDPSALDDSAIESMKNMDELEFVLLSNATTVTEPDPSLTDLIATLKKELPETLIHAEAEPKP
jgi:hypothetical protein